MKHIYTEEGARPIKAWTDIDDSALAQAKNLARPPTHKDIDEVMANQTDLVEVVHTLKAVMCVKGR